MKRSSCGLTGVVRGCHRDEARVDQDPRDVKLSFEVPLIILRVPRSPKLLRCFLDKGSKWTLGGFEK